MMKAPGSRATRPSPRTSNESEGGSGIFSLVVAVVLAGVVRTGWDLLQPTGRRWLLPFRVAALMTKPPEARVAMPLRNLQVSRIADTWHAGRTGGRRHEGQDLFAPGGTPVYSATHGFVIRIGDAGIGGNAVSVMGAGGRVYYYAHLSRFAPGLRIGDEVTEADGARERGEYRECAAPRPRICTSESMAGVGLLIRCRS